LAEATLAEEHLRASLMQPEQHRFAFLSGRTAARQQAEGRCARRAGKCSTRRSIGWTPEDREFKTKAKRLLDHQVDADATCQPLGAILLGLAARPSLRNLLLVLLARASASSAC
jgi:hypothetical protein